MKSWQEYKEEAWNRILRDREIGYLDPDIFDVLEVFFKKTKSFTQSSCSGRIVIVDAVTPWDRKNSSIIFKNHLGISGDDIKRALESSVVWNLWLIVQGPILHVYAMNEDEAWNLIKIARQAGFKHSGILSKNEKGVLIELKTGVRMVHLLKAPDYSPIQDPGKLAEVANKILKIGKIKLRKLKEAIEISSTTHNVNVEDVKEISK
ncbi:MAG: hypothetical protein OWQ54_01145 [Sulfolobaceae archaeon]|nr:hypothetical protein [Sulfolobaceae archaeon]